jgi:hypothetical protein
MFKVGDKVKYVGSECDWVNIWSLCVGVDVSNLTPTVVGVHPRVIQVGYPTISEKYWSDSPTNFKKLEGGIYANKRRTVVASNGTSADKSNGD